MQAVDGLLDRQVADVQQAMAAALDPRKLNHAAGGLLAGPAGRAATVPASKRQVHPRGTCSSNAVACATGSMSIHTVQGVQNINLICMLPHVVSVLRCEFLQVCSLCMTGRCFLHIFQKVLGEALAVLFSPCQRHLSFTQDANCSVCVRNCLLPSFVQEVLWEKLGEALSALAAAVTAAWHAQRVLAKKRDPLSHALFLDEVAPPGTPLPVDAFWCFTYDIPIISMSDDNARCTTRTH